MTDFPLKFLQPDRSKAIFLGRVEDDPQPAYKVVGKTKCMHCDKWLWLGTETFDVVNNGEATPFCVPCGGDMGCIGIPINVYHDR